MTYGNADLLRAVRAAHPSIDAHTHSRQARGDLFSIETEHASRWVAADRADFMHRLEEEHWEDWRDRVHSECRRAAFAFGAVYCTWAVVRWLRDSSIHYYRHRGNAVGDSTALRRNFNASGRPGHAVLGEAMTAAAMATLNLTNSTLGSATRFSQEAAEWHTGAPDGAPALDGTHLPASAAWANASEYDLAAQPQLHRAAQTLQTEQSVSPVFAAMIAVLILVVASLVALRILHRRRSLRADEEASDERVPLLAQEDG
jgi:hypothetical protein